MSKTSDAAATIMAAELSALTAINSAMADFDAKLAAAIADLDYPAGFPSNALRIATAVKSAYQWNKTEAGTLVTNMTAAQSSTPTPDSSN